jgi:capsular polysaccharide biosynthesis protein
MFPPALARLMHRVLGTAGTLESLAARSYQVAPPHRRIAPPAIFTEGCLGRITGLGIATTFQKEFERIKGGEQVHGPVSAWELHNAVLCGSHVYLGNLKHRVDTRAEAWLKAGPQERIPDGVMSCSYYGSLFFGHAVKDDIPLTLLAESVGNPIRSSAPLFAHQEAYMRMVRLHSQPHDSILVDRLTIFDDHNQSESRALRMREVRSRMRALFPRPVHNGVFINRKDTGDLRRLTNEQQVVDLFAARGFGIVDPDLMSASEIQKLVSGAQIVAGVEGSHLAHGVLASADECTFLVLQPPGRFNNIYKDVTDALEMRYAFVVGNAAPTGQFSIDPGALSGMLDQLQAMNTSRT